jgi:4-hydroxybenzoate polyprenyltransferase
VWFGLGYASAVARFGRLTAAGLGMSSVVIGHASAGGSLPRSVLIGLLLVGLTFHVVAFALNDLFDLELDRTDPTRAGSPLVAGRITPLAAGIVIAATAVASFVLDWLFFGVSGARGGASGTVALAAGYACLVFYDAFSKALPVPLVADAVQGAGWACLVWYGAVRGGGATAGTTLAALFVFGFVVIVNAVHGGLRDLRNDSRRGARTAAIVFGATLQGDVVTVPPLLRGLAWLVQLGLAAIALVSPYGVRGGPGWWVVWYLVALATTGLAVWLLRQAVRSSADPVRFKNLGAAHILALWLPLTAMTAMYGGAWQGLAAAAAMTVPLFGNKSFRTSFRAMPAGLSELRAALGPPLRKARSLAVTVAQRRGGPPSP